MEIIKEIDVAKDEITKGQLMLSPDLSKEYCHSVGYIKGLRFIENLIKDINEEIDETQIT